MESLQLDESVFELTLALLTVLHSLQLAGSDWHSVRVQRLDDAALGIEHAIARIDPVKSMRPQRVVKHFYAL